jgi:hypothetical protein
MQVYHDARVPDFHGQHREFRSLALMLSKSQGQQDSFKVTARQMIDHQWFLSYSTPISGNRDSILVSPLMVVTGNGATN